MSQFALRALVLINVDAYAGQWCTLEWLVGRLLTPMRVVQAVCDALADEGLLQMAIVDGVRSYAQPNVLIGGDITQGAAQ